MFIQQLACILKSQYFKFIRFQPIGSISIFEYLRTARCSKISISICNKRQRNTRRISVIIERRRTNIRYWMYQQPQLATQLHHQMLSELWIPTPGQEEPNVAQHLTPDHKHQSPLKVPTRGRKSFVAEQIATPNFQLNEKVVRWNADFYKQLPDLIISQDLKQIKVVSWVIAKQYLSFHSFRTRNSSAVFCAQVIRVSVTLSGPLFVDKI
ncbi:Hypothetical_protein [Hexamita inflata]|uniref:Hypothetical_protein n=1 Tax=Hexamita inflata TaxID=28002 RepID=A0AA86PU53_9EUKA|nr:Hypothetical protein HINF_LOCUS31842 [Hexamita inflata]CAI9963514.1 Hypothetical protein HINF_LOCUS51159 [Hexamita inflata]